VEHHFTTPCIFLALHLSKYYVRTLKLTIPLAGAFSICIPFLCVSILSVVVKISRNFLVLNVLCKFFILGGNSWLKVNTYPDFVYRARCFCLTKSSNQVQHKRKFTMRLQNRLSRVSGHAILCTDDFYLY
jgi:hypothetical protein